MKNNFFRSLGSKALLISTLISYNLFGGENNSNLDYILTFDDEPYLKNKTTELVNLLKKYSENDSVFYLTGEGMQKNPESVKVILDAGYEVGWHSQNHRYIKSKSDEFLKEDVENWLDILYKIDSTYVPKYARFPYGASKKSQIDLLKEYDLTIYPAFGRKNTNTCNWNIDSHDWEKNSEFNLDKFERKCLNYTHGNVVVLFHQYISNSNQTDSSTVTSDMNVFEEYLKTIKKCEEMKNYTKFYE